MVKDIIHTWDIEIRIGKYKGRSLSTICEINPKYIVWAHTNNVFEIPNWALIKAKEVIKTSFHSYRTKYSKCDNSNFDMSEFGNRS